MADHPYCTWCGHWHDPEDDRCDAPAHVGIGACPCPGDTIVTRLREAWADPAEPEFNRGVAHAADLVAAATRNSAALGDQNEEAKADSRSASSDDKVYASFNEALEDCFPHEAKRRRRAVVPPESWEHDDQLRMIAGPRGQGEHLADRLQAAIRSIDSLGESHQSKKAAE